VSNLDSTDAIKKLDSQDMLKLLMGFGTQCEEAVALGRSVPVIEGKERIKKILFVGLGGSAIGANLVASFLGDRMALPATVVRDYELPAWTDESTLVFATSYSGNTEETLASAEEALKRKSLLVTASSGGKLKEFAQAKNCPYVAIPTGYPPRAALGFAFFVPLMVLKNAGWAQIEDSEINETLALIKRLTKLYGPISPEKDNPAKQLAQSAFGHMVHIYSTSRLDAVSIRWRGQVSENAKQLASHHLLPEMNHNEIVGWEHPRNALKATCVFFLRDEADHPQVKKRIEITKNIIQDYAAKVHEVHAQGASALARVFSLVVLGDFMSYYLALLNGVDPTPVERINYLKSTLAKM